MPLLRSLLKRYNYLCFAVLFLFAQPACQQLDKNPFQKRTQWDQYHHDLISTALAKTSMAIQWYEAGKRALTDSLTIAPPYLETGFFRAETPQAYGYTIYLKQGQRCQISITTQPQQADLFLDFYKKSTQADTSVLEWIAELSDKENQLEIEIENTGFYHLRVQAPLLVSLRYELKIGVSPSLGFPVLGGKNRDIGSFWGDPRGSRRKHKGIDIFAKKGTPVVAISSGVVSRVRTGGLGGKTVWVRDRQTGHNQYYAHLDSQWVSRGQRVMPGDTLGTVGNTGNARTTPPHLHFGIYAKNGAIDPLAFVRKESNEYPDFEGNLKWIGQQVRTVRTGVLLRQSPYKKSIFLDKLYNNTALRILGGTDDYYRIQEPSGRIGFVRKNEVTSTERPVKKLLIKKATYLANQPDTSLAVPIAHLRVGEEVKVLAYSGDFDLVENSDGVKGYLGGGLADFWSARL